MVLIFEVTSLLFVQLDDAEFAVGGAVKAKVAAEMEINDLRQQLDDMTKAKHEVQRLIMSYVKFYCVFFL